MTNSKSKPVWEMIDDDLAKQCESALAKYRAGEDDVRLEIGELVIKLWDRKDNANRDTVRMSMEEFMNVVRQCHINGAALAASTMAEVAARLAGYKLADPGNEEAEG